MADGVIVGDSGISVGDSGLIVDASGTACCCAPAPCSTIPCASLPSTLTVSGFLDPVWHVPCSNASGLPSPSDTCTLTKKTTSGCLSRYTKDANGNTAQTFCGTDDQPTNFGAIGSSISFGGSDRGVWLECNVAGFWALRIGISKLLDGIVLEYRLAGSSPIGSYSFFGIVSGSGTCTGIVYPSAMAVA